MPESVAAISRSMISCIGKENRALRDGLLSAIERKTGWLLAEQAGLEGPCRMQSLLGRSRWEPDALRVAVGPCGGGAGRCRGHAGDRRDGFFEEW